MPSVLLGLLLITGCASQRPFVQAPPFSWFERRAKSASSYVLGELLVKVTQETAQAIERARQGGTLPLVGIASLDRLFAKHGVTAIEPVFPNAPGLEGMKAKFPERAKRAPPDAKAPDLSRYYTLHFNPTTDVLQAVEVFNADPHIEEAQPNHLATINASN